MPRPPGSDGPRGGDGEDYDWLYGRPGSGAGAQPPPSDDPEPTRLMPVQPRPDSAPQPNPAPAAATQVQPPVRPVQPVPPAPTRTRARGGRRWGRTVRLVLLAWLAFLVAVPIYAFTSIDRVAAAPAGQRPDSDGTNYLIVGSDSRKGLTAAQRRKYGTGNAAGRRTDTIMVLHTGSGPNVLISIPRDSLVEIPGHGTTKINAAYALGGAKLLVRTLESHLDLRIDEYVEIGMGGLVNVVDAVGGIRLCTSKRLDDRDANLHMAKGCHQADGSTALAYARSRHTQTRGDIDRGTNQRKVVAKVGDKVKSPWSVLNPVRYLRLNLAGASSVKIGKDTGPVAAFGFVWAMTRTSGDAGMTCTMPISDLAVHWDTARVQRLAALLRADETDKIGKDLCTATGLAGVD